MGDVVRLLGVEAVTRLTALAALACLRRVSHALADAAQLSAEQDVERCRTLWGVVYLGITRRVLDSPDLYIVEDDGIVRVPVSRFHHWGPWVVAVQYAPDGGGITRVLDARQEVPWPVARALREAYYADLEGGAPDDSGRETL